MPTRPNKTPFTTRKLLFVVAVLAMIFAGIRATREYVYVPGSKRRMLFNGNLMLTPGAKSDALTHANRRRASEYHFTQPFYAITDGDLQELVSYRDLKFVELGATVISDSGMQDFAKLKKLRSLSFSSSEITDQGLWYLHECQQLESLSISGCNKVPDEAIQELRNSLPQTAIRIYRKR